MLFEWDENKNRKNRAKHGISFEVAATVFDDPHCASRIESTYHCEERWQSIGRVGDLLLLFVSHTYQDADDIVVRIISAREALPRERRQYENGTF